MKDFFKKTYKKYKKTLIMLGVCIAILIILFFLMTSFIANNPEVIINFVDTATLSKEIIPFTIMTVIAFLTGAMIIILFVIMFLKMLFPNKKKFSSFLMKDEVSFLINIPKEIGKEIKKNNEQKK